MKESSCIIDSRSFVGAEGLLQITENPLKDICTNLDSMSEVIGEENLANNIQCGIKILKNKYYAFGEGVLESNSYADNNVFKNIVDNCVQEHPSYSEYSSWSASLRGYNGWGCNEPYADVSYVEKVTGFYSVLSDV